MILKVFLPKLTPYCLVMNLEDYLNTPNPYSERCKSIFDFYLENGSFERIKPHEDSLNRNIFHEESISI